MTIPEAVEPTAHPKVLRSPADPVSASTADLMARVARSAGLSRESLYKALSGDRSPSFDTVLKVVAALGLRLHAEPAVR